MTNIIKAVELIRSFSNGSKQIITEVTCKRCAGNGVLHQYRSVDNGKCYECEGTGVTEQTIKVNSDQKVVMVNRTTQIKTIKPVNDNEAMKRSMIQTNEEHKARREAIKRQKEEDAKLLEEMENDTESFSWDD